MSRTLARAAFSALLLSALVGACGTSPEEPQQATANSILQAPRLRQARLIVREAKPTISGGMVLSSQRTLPVTLRLPRGSGIHPLLVFIHGYNSSPKTYARIIDVLVRGGFVVAAPSFPLEDPEQGNGLDRGDLVHEAQDVSAVLNALQSSHWSPWIDWQSVTAFGHSDGADVALSLGYDPAKLDKRITRVLAAAPDPLDFSPVTHGPPLLLIHGDADPIVPFASSEQVFGALHATRCLLKLHGADHAGAILGAAKATASFSRIFDTELLAFLRAPTVSLATACPALSRSSLLLATIEHAAS
jgi:predicted esterase